MAKLTKIQELKLKRSALKSLQFVLDMDPDILTEQKKYWLSCPAVVDVDQQIRIKIALERHSHMPVRWIKNSEMEITIDPVNRLPSFKHPPKSQSRSVKR